MILLDREVLLDRYIEMGLLFDFYGQLLTEKKQEFMRLYHEDDLSLSEIAQEYNISRAAVYDSIKSSEKALLHYEELLGLVKRFLDTRAVLEEIGSTIEEIKYIEGLDSRVKNKLLNVLDMVKNLE